MLDGFIGRATRQAWRVKPGPHDVSVAGLEGTGSAVDLGMAIGALNSGASSRMRNWGMRSAIMPTSSIRRGETKALAPHRWLCRGQVDPKTGRRVSWHG